MGWVKRLLGTMIIIPSIAFAQTPATSGGDELAVLWKAKRRFGPDARGTLIIEQTRSGYTADMIGLTTPVSVNNNELAFELPNREGGFRGKRQGDGTIRGFWFSSTVNAATPVTLAAQGSNRWSGQVVPLEDTQTFYLLLKKQADGSLAAVLRNIERDYGGQLGVRGLTRNGSAVALTGRRGAQTRDTVIFTGTIDSAQRVMTINFPFRGGTVLISVAMTTNRAPSTRAGETRRATSIVPQLHWMTAGRLQA